MKAFFGKMNSKCAAALAMSLAILFGAAGCLQERNEPVNTYGSVTATAAPEVTWEAVVTQSPDKVNNPGVGTGVATAVKPDEIPEYSGTAFTVINEGQPNFSGEELTDVAYEKYSELDSLGRCGIAVASCGKEIMPAENEKRGSISSVKPSGWVQAQYDCVNGKYLYNRSHLIGWQLSAENANNKNLIAGTRYMNTEGMLPFENMVADYIKETGNHVAYRVTPIFKGNNLVCSGVQMEAYSIEDEGEGICFNVYCYNVQPGVEIDYSTGSSTGVQPTAKPIAVPTAKPTAAPTAKPTMAPTAKPTPAPTRAPVVNVPETQPSQGNLVWLPKTGSKYHSNPNCSGMKNPTQVPINEAISRGYEACKKCY